MPRKGARPLQHLDNDGMHKPSDHVVKAFKDGRRPRPRLDVSQGLQMQELIRKAWSDEPAERPSPAEMVEELKKIQASPGSQCCSRMHSPPRTLSPDPSVLSLPLLEEEPVSPSPAKEGHCAMSVSYDCCPFCGDEELQSRKAIWLLGIWRALLLGLLHAFQSVTNDFLVGLGKTHMEAGSVVAMNQLLAMGLMPLVAFGGYFVGLRCTLVVISLLPFLGALLLAFLPTVPLVLEAGCLMHLSLNTLGLAYQGYQIIM
eukprot:g32651.t1